MKMVPRLMGTAAVRQVAALVLFLGVIFGGIEIVRRSAYMSEQRRLYQTYLMKNGWKPSTKEAYGSLVPLLIEVEHVPMVDPSEEEVRRLKAELSSEGERVRKTPGLSYTPPAGQFHSFASDISMLARSYGWYLDQVITVNNLNDPMSRKVVAGDLAQDEIRTFRGNLNDIPALLASKTSKNLALSDAVFQQRAFRYIREQLGDVRARRVALEQQIFSPDTVPPGLDLAYARSLSTTEQQ